MTAYTTGFEIPYPQSTDLVKDGATAMENLATQVDTQMGYLVNRNYIINGNMQVWQRATSQAGVASGGYFTADRWYFIANSLGTWTLTRDTDVPTAQGFGYSYKMDNTTADAAPAAGDFLYLAQKIEGQNLQNVLKGTASARPLTLSFWVKTTTSGTMVVELEDPTNARFVSAAVATTANTWVYATATFPADTTGTIPNTNANGLEVHFWMGAGSNYTAGGSLNTTWGTTTNRRAFGVTNFGASTANNIWITGVQLEVGDADTPFEREPIGDTLAKCYRYYYRKTSAGIQGSAYATNAGVFMGFTFPVVMRATPADPATPALANAVEVVGVATYTPTFIARQRIDAQGYSFASAGIAGAFGIGHPCFWKGGDFLFDAEL